MDRPILFSTPLVRPTIDGYKTVTRRLRGLKVINEIPGEWVYIGGAANMGRDLEIIDGKQEANFYNTSTGAEERILCPYGAPGDTLWVRETFVPLTNGYGYKADGLIRCGKIPGTKEYYQPRMTWKPGIHMTRKASRITLELLKVDVQRAHDITEEEAKLEGVQRGKFGDYVRNEPTLVQCTDGQYGTFYDGFKYTWMTLNGRESWEKNPWVWRLHFKLLKCTTP